MAHDHSSPEHEPEHHGHEQQEGSDLNVPLIVTVGLISAILLVVIGIGTIGWFRYELQQEQRVKIIERENDALQALNTEAEAKLRNIDRAMVTVVERYAGASAEQRRAVQRAAPTTPAQTGGAGETGGAAGETNAGDGEPTSQSTGDTETAPAPEVEAASP